MGHLKNSREYLTKLYTNIFNKLGYMDAFLENLNEQNWPEEAEN